MTIKIVGKHPEMRRVVTNLYSLDRACINDSGDLGLPVGTGYEVFGLTGTGKSTFTYSLAGILGKNLGGGIALSDFEGFDKKFLSRVLESQGFDKEVHLAYHKNDEEQLDKFVVLMREKCNVGIVDSIGAIASLGESEGDIGERNMGHRGFIMAQFSRKMMKLFREKENIVSFFTNHWYPKLGGYGYVTPGGEVKKYILTVRINLKRKETFPEGSYVLSGTVVKNRWGYQDRTFTVFMLAGLGLHSGLSAMWDCIELKLVKRVKESKDKSKPGLYLNDEKLGKISYFAGLAREGKTEPFDLFYKLLEEHGKETKSVDNEGMDESDRDTEVSDVED